ncbi:MAG: DMT family transporter [Bdellovibrionota bacterium]
MPKLVNLKINPLLWMVLASLFFSIMAGIVKSLEHLPTWEIVFFRAFINLVWLLPWAFRDPLYSWRKEWPALLTRGVSGWVSLVLYFYALEHMRLADAVMLNHTSPIIVLLLSFFVLHERITPVAVMFVGLALVGVAFILKPSFEFSGADAVSLGGIAGFASALTSAVAYVSLKVATRSISTTSIVVTFAGVASVLSFVPMVMHYVPPTPKEWLLLFLCGTFATAAQATMTKSYSLLPASVASPLSLLNVLFSALIGLAIWSEIPDNWSIFGSVLIVIGVIGSSRSKARRTTRAV